MERKEICLITQGDDCGSNHSANMAILEGFKQGILKNTGLMAPCPAIREAAELMANEKGMCFGIHLTVNAEWDNVKWGPVLPPSEVPSLVDENGMFFQNPQLLYEHYPKLDEMMKELQAQLDLVRSLGFDVKYADSHMGFYWVIPGLAEKVDLWCKKNGLVNTLPYFHFLPRKEVAGDPVDRLIASLDAAESGTYLILAHPACDSEEMRALGHTGYPGEVVASEREWDRRLFSDQRLLEYCKEKQITVVRYDEIYK